MLYYVQNFSYDGPGNSLCYGEMPTGHDHKIASQFSVDVKAYLVAQKLKNVTPGDFKSSQPKPKVAAKEFKWSASKKKWEKA